MKSLPKTGLNGCASMKQRGVVLFFALISLLAIMLAAVALIRSVDTSIMIAGNLAFKQAATMPTPIQLSAFLPMPRGTLSPTSLR